MKAMSGVWFEIKDFRLVKAIYYIILNSQNGKSLFQRNNSFLFRDSQKF